MDVIIGIKEIAMMEIEIEEIQLIDKEKIVVQDQKKELIKNQA